MIANDQELQVTQEHLGGKKFTPFSERKILDTLTEIFLRGLLSHTGNP